MELINYDKDDLVKLINLLLPLRNEKQKELDLIDDLIDEFDTELEARKA